MKTKSIDLTIEQAIELYKSNDSSLREVALQAFTKEELTESWREITSLDIAIQALNMNPCEVRSTVDNLPEEVKYLYLLSLVRKALNGDWKPKMSEGAIFYPWLRYYPEGSVYDKDIWIPIANFRDINDNKMYILVGGGYCCNTGGLSNFGYGFGNIDAYHGLLGCKSEEIAKHLGEHFGRLIFNAIYSQYNNYVRV